MVGLYHASVAAGNAPRGAESRATKGALQRAPAERVEGSAAIASGASVRPPTSFARLGSNQWRWITRWSV
jgi:hypothetical protein